MPTITKPIILDETGLRIAEAIEALIEGKYVLTSAFNAMFEESGIYIDTLVAVAAAAAGVTEESKYLLNETFNAMFTGTGIYIEEEI